MVAEARATRARTHAFTHSYVNTMSEQNDNERERVDSKLNEFDTRLTTDLSKCRRALEYAIAHFPPHPTHHPHRKIEANIENLA